MSNVIQLPGEPAPKPDPTIKAKFNLAETLYKVQRILNANAACASELELPDTAIALDHIATMVGDQKDTVIASMNDEDEDDDDN